MRRQVFSTRDLYIPNSTSIYFYNKGKRHTRCGNTGCRCHADPPQLNGPYLTWTRKVDGKTVTRTLDPAQAERLRPLLENSRQLHELVSELDALALRQVEHDPAQPNP